MKKWPLSVVIITLNEEKNILRCLKSIPQASEIILVDSFSKDQTVTLAKSLGSHVHVYEKEFQGYRAQKQMALDYASQPWVLSLDADEEVSPKLLLEIEKIMEGNSTFDFYRCPRLSFHLGRWIKHGGWYPDFQTRLFRKQKARWTGGEVHEKIHVEGEGKTLKAPIFHYVFSSLAHQMDTNNRYSSFGAKDLKLKGYGPSFLKMVFKPLGKFFECYFWKRGFLDGMPGFIIALGAAQSLFLKYAKLWEMENIN